MLNGDFICQSVLISHQIKRGRYNGKCDIGLCIVTFIRELQRINIDETNSVYHIKIKDKKVFEQWLEQIALHRNNRQRILEQQSPLIRKISSNDEIKNLPEENYSSPRMSAFPSSDRLFYNGEISPPPRSISSKIVSFRFRGYTSAIE